MAALFVVEPDLSIMGLGFNMAQQPAELLLVPLSMPIEPACLAACSPQLSRRA
jgi:hypothetical protein